MLKFYILGITIISFSLAEAQETLNDTLYEKNTEYIKTYLNRITGRVFYVNTSNSYVVNGRQEDLKFKLDPNKQDRIGASASFRFISLSYSFSPDFLSENKDNRDSKLFNLNLRTYFGKWMQTFDVFSEKGFYVEFLNTSSYLPRFRSFKIGGSTSYIFNENFSFRAIASQDEKQLKSAGSLIPSVTYYYTKLDIRSDDDITDQSLHTYDIAFTPSYCYNFVPTKNLFLSLGASAGIGLNYSKNVDTNGIEEDENLTSLLTEFSFFGTVTYDIDNFYLGSHYSYLILNHNTDRSSYVNDHIPFLQIFVGYRFKAPKSWIEFADKLQDKVGM